MERNGLKFAAYRHIGHRRVQGYTETAAIGLLHAVDDYQRAAGIGGPIAEIGVHHGQLFIAMKLLQQPGEASIAIDLFEDQDANIDKSGQGDRDRFLAHLDSWTDRDGLVIHQGDSTQISPGEIAEMSGVRLFSVDGGHTQEIVLSDMRLAEKSLTEGGVVIADDVFNQQWPGVCVGTVHYMEQGGALVPFYIGYNKVLFTQPEHAARYRQALDAAYSGRTMTAVFESSFVGHPVSVLVPVPKHPVHIARRNETLRSTYRKITKGLR
ncbi:class I SAM-dependent methyltransferase [Mycolicibacterium neoaurum]|uniref:class I SAM-dependent methyltransferase n=1 Tax=Mycolicibacterium neoaurum TaxID=1795 RepID=UPI001F4D2980|nr:class I SAM-dependent methyltransferase [Mycolicibacterium neoaurum]